MYFEALAAIRVEVDSAAMTVRVIADATFEAAFLHVENIAERALMQRSIEGFRALAGFGGDASDDACLLALIAPNPEARSQHAFMAHSFRDWVRQSLWAAPVFIDLDDTAIIKLGLGWRYRSRDDGGDIRGKQACMAFLNDVVRGLEDDICEDVRQFSREAVIDFAVRNHEAAVVDRDQWHRTAAAVLALHDDKEATLDVMTDMDFKISGVLQTSRLLVEFALGECPDEDGRVPGHLQMSRVMAKLLLLVHRGGWSDAIRWDVIEPGLRIAPLGDIHGNLTFHQEVMAPFGRATSTLRINDSMSRYAENVEDPPNLDAALPDDDEFPPEFWEALAEQFGADANVVRQLLGTLENLGIERRQAIFRIRKSELLAACEADAAQGEQAAALAKRLIFAPRGGWREPPTGFEGKDIFPWRFRRRLSVLRMPLIQLSQTEDPEILVAPGLVDDAVRYMLACYHRGDFPLWQLAPKMRRWAGRSSDHRGHLFSGEVAARMRELGWQVQSEVLVTALLGKGFPVDYGDIDVLAWQPDTGRVLIMECKDVQFRKTDGEVAEQLADFRGLEVDGKRDLLRKNLDRLAIVSEHRGIVKAKLGLTTEPKIEGELVFRNPVPMQFAWEQLRTKTALHVFDNLNEI